jgi:phosphoribosylanthranilate isomerase
MIQIKICCIKNAAEAKLAVQTGANALGLVSQMPSGPGVITYESIRDIISGLAPFVTSVLLTSKSSDKRIKEQLDYCRPDAVQLCEPVSVETLISLRTIFPRTRFIRVIHVTGEDSIREALDFQNFVNAFLLDTGQRSGPQKQLGGTGRVHDWAISAEIVRQVHIPVILAGGLNAENVTTAIKTAHPYAVDVCSGVRSNGKLDTQKLTEFVNAVRNRNF